MKETKLLRNKMEENKTEIEECEKKMLAGGAGAVLVTGATIAGAFILNTFVDGVTIPLLLFGSMFPIAAFNYVKLKGEQIKSAKIQNNHLRKIKTEGIERNDELNKKRSNQIANLDEKKYALQEPMQMHTLLTSLGIVTWVLGTAASWVTPPAILASIGGLTITTVALNKLSKDSKKELEYETRIENLQNDLLLIPHYGVEQQGKVSSSQNTSMGNDPSKTYDKELDEYLERIGTPNYSSVPVQKTKNRGERKW